METKPVRIGVRRLTTVAVALAMLLPGQAAAVGPTPYLRLLREPAYNAGLAVDAAGVHHVLLRDGATDTTSHYLTDRGGRWTSTLLPGWPGDIAAGPDGHVYIVTLLQLGNLYPAARLYDDTSGTMAGEDVTAYGQTCSGTWRQASLGFGPDDTVHVAWSDIGATGVCYRARTAGTWGTTQFLGAKMPVVGGMDMVVDPDGVPHVFVAGLDFGTGPDECTAACAVEMVVDADPVATYLGPVHGYSLDVARRADGAYGMAVANDASMVYFGNDSGSWQATTVATANINDGTMSWSATGPVLVYTTPSGVRRADRGAGGWAISTLTSASTDTTATGALDASGGLHVSFTRQIYHASGWLPGAELLAPDTVAPTVSAPRVTPTRGAVIGTSVPLTVTWNPTDALSGVATSAIQQQTGTTWATVGSGLTSASLKRSLVPGSTAYAFRVRATDRAGRTSGWTTGPTFRLARYQGPATGVVTFGGTWRTATSSSHSGGSARYATSTSASVTITGTMRGIAWVGTYGLTRGSARIWVDGVPQYSLSTYRSATTYRPIAWSMSWTSAGPHTIVIKPAGTAGHPRIDIDAIVIVR